MSQKLPVNKFEWIEEISQFNKDFRKNYNQETDEGYFLEVDVQYPKKYMNFIMTYHFYHQQRKLRKVEKLVTNLYD